VEEGFIFISVQILRGRLLSEMPESNQPVNAHLTTSPLGATQPFLEALIN
jgi:hypothetical protein